MIHLGDITKINGAEIPIVDVIIGGSPCQDLSVAGKGAGLDGERSGLFIEQIRVVKEMREHDRSANRRTGEFVRPRYMVWENVPGATSSNHGRDFQTVLTEIVKIVNPDAPDVPLFGGGGNKRWPKAGAIYGVGTDGCPFSISYRLHDAQFWGVPQRRKRIALVADFAGLSASEILFEREGVSGNTEQGRAQRETTAADSQESVGTASYTLKVRGGVERDCYGKTAGKGALVQKEKSGTLGVSQDQTLFVADITANNRDNDCWTVDEKMSNTYCHHDQANTLSARDYKQPQAAVYTHDLTVRRLTPLECERLQGFPDEWTNLGDWKDSKGKIHKNADSPRYKALGNSIATPFWFYLLRRISAMFERPATMGSLFSGIGGFDLCWVRCNGSKSVLWSSEIEEFPIAVMKKHFGDGTVDGDVRQYL